MRQLTLSAWAFTLCAAISFAQPVSRKEPALYAATERTSRVEAPPPGIRFGLRKPRELALAPLSGTERAEFAGPGPRLRTGVHRHLPATLLSTGDWENTAEGKRVWRMTLRSPGALGTRGGVSEFLGRFREGVVAQRRAGRRPLHRPRSLRRRPLLERHRLLRFGYVGIRAWRRQRRRTLPPFEIRTISHQTFRTTAPGPQAGSGPRRLLPPRPQLLPRMEVGA